MGNYNRMAPSNPLVVLLTPYMINTHNRHVGRYTDVNTCIRHMLKHNLIRINTYIITNSSILNMYIMVLCLSFYIIGNVID